MHGAFNKATFEWHGERTRIFGARWFFFVVVVDAVIVARFPRKFDGRWFYAGG